MALSDPSPEATETPVRFIPTTELSNALKHLRDAFVAVAIFSFFINLLMLVPMVAMKLFFLVVLPTQSIPTLWMILIVAVGLMIVYGVLDWSRSRVLNRAATSLDYQVDKRVFDVTYQQALHTPGSLASIQPINDLVSIRSFLSGGTVTALFDAPWTPIWLLIIFLIHPWLGWIALIAAILIFSLAVLNEILTRQGVMASIEEQIRANDFSTANLRNAEVLEAMGMIERLRARWLRYHRSVIHKQTLTNDISAVISGIARTIRMNAQIIMLATGVYLAIQQEIVFIVVIVVIMLMARALAPIDQSISGWKQFVGARAAWRRLDGTLQRYPARPARMRLPQPRGHLSVEGVAAVPPGARLPALRGIQFEVHPGEILGVLGPSAAGKSSLARVLVGVWPVFAGDVRIDGASIVDWDRQQLGPYLGYLPQDIELFAGTIAENISRFGPLDPEAVVEAARKTGLHEMILRLPNGYDTVIGMHSGVLSGGQRQRVALARAVYGDPRLLVLDEPNSNLDEAGEAALLETLNRLRDEGRSIVIISQRPAVIPVMDRILVLKDGQQVALGPRTEVMARLTQRH